MRRDFCYLAFWGDVSLYFHWCSPSTSHHNQHRPMLEACSMGGCPHAHEQLVPCSEDCSSWGIPARGSSRRNFINSTGHLFSEWVRGANTMVARKLCYKRHALVIPIIYYAICLIPWLKLGKICAPKDCFGVSGCAFTELDLDTRTTSRQPTDSALQNELASQPRLYCALTIYLDRMHAI